MTKEDLTAWALKNGFTMVAGHPSLTKPSRKTEAIVRIQLKATVATLEIKTPAGRWDKIKSTAYKDITPDQETGTPRGLGLVNTPGIAKLMQDNRDAAVFR
jgi:hypothetical protein